MVLHPLGCVYLNRIVPRYLGFANKDLRAIEVFGRYVGLGCVLLGNSIKNQTNKQQSAKTKILPPSSPLILSGNCVILFLPNNG